jgi:Zn-dependent peptidase ImmA (M78 family)
MRLAIQILEKSMIVDPPVDVYKICKDNDVSIQFAEMENDVSGMLKNISGKGSIYVNKNHSLVRQRFTIAHELGHHFLGHVDGLHIDKKVMFRDSKSSTAEFEPEIMANRFAAELLMPRSFISKTMKTIGDHFDDELIEDIAKQYKVSTTALSIRLQNLGIKF